ncbi:hypothetical protein SAMN06297468_2964 [Altererythrobacter xiamenensis]|uniref:Uncharacterized protein n=1 Tax=Altererythrobacter xiamenensis TaxID=1316679 RepID=A0A1Y6FSH1_9SPHN|nr:hypothetical protein [Altererythrobacter xiamenensis]SMQ75812.1 hypothetical protein SAMN06297468_2964 [Altererythrobacter xiamenensis]
MDDDRRNDRRDYADRLKGERRENDRDHSGIEKRSGDRRSGTDRRERD